MNKITIVFEDDYLIAVNKPAGLLVYLPPGSKKDTTVLDLVSKKLNFKNVGERSGIVHRLDRDTSGLIVIAKDSKTEKAMKALFKNREVQKEYLTIVWGNLEPERGLINIPLGRASKDRLKVVPKKQGKESQTEYQKIEYLPQSDMSLVRVDLKTGRTHQIRVHMAAIGHPVVGDAKYSNRKTELKRQFLHARNLTFVHPITGKKISLRTDLPEELESFLKNLK